MASSKSSARTTSQSGGLVEFARQSIPGLSRIAIFFPGSSEACDYLLGPPFELDLIDRVIAGVDEQPTGKVVHISLDDEFVLAVRPASYDCIAVVSVAKVSADPIGRLTQAFAALAQALSTSFAETKVSEPVSATTGHELLAGLIAAEGGNRKARLYGILELVRRLLNSSARLLVINKGRVGQIVSDEGRGSSRDRSIRIIANKGMASDDRVLFASNESEGNVGIEGPLYCQKHGIGNFVIGLPQSEGRGEYIGLYLENITAEARSTVQDYVQTLNLKEMRPPRPWANRLQWLVASAIPVALLVWLLLPDDFEITAEARAIPSESVTLAAPLEGRLEERLVAVGDYVTEGDVLVRLDSEQLAAEAAQAELDHLLAELNARDARATGTYAEYQIALRKSELAEARLNQMRERVAWLSTSSPATGRVIEIISQSRVGDIIGRGERLAEIQTSGTMKIEIDLAQQDIRFVAVGQNGQFVVRGMIDGEFRVRVTEPAFSYADQSADDLRFRTTAELTAVTGGVELSKGMTGIVRLFAGRRRNYEIVGRYLVDWVRLTAWEQLGIRF